VLLEEILESLVGQLIEKLAGGTPSFQQAFLGSGGSRALFA
jgi:hypothetical protein